MFPHISACDGISGTSFESGDFLGDLDRGDADLDLDRGSSLVQDISRAIEASCMHESHAKGPLICCRTIWPCGSGILEQLGCVHTV